MDSWLPMTEQRPTNNLAQTSEQPLRGNDLGLSKAWIEWLVRASWSAIILKPVPFDGFWSLLWVQIQAFPFSTLEMPKVRKVNILPVALCKQCISHVGVVSAAAQLGDKVIMCLFTESLSFLQALKELVFAHPALVSVLLWCRMREIHRELDRRRNGRDRKQRKKKWCGSFCLLVCGGILCLGLFLFVFFVRELRVRETDGEGPLLSVRVAEMERQNFEDI